MITSTDQFMVSNFCVCKSQLKTRKRKSSQPLIFSVNLISSVHNLLDSNLESLVKYVKNWLHEMTKGISSILFVT